MSNNEKDISSCLKGLTGSQIFHRMLLEHNVDTVFAYPGGAVLPIYDELYDTPIKIVRPCHEQGGCHMADGYARSSGKTGVVIATSGPGATNLVTGLGTANMDSIPMVIFTGQVKSHLIGNDAFQEADVTGITRPVTKHNFLVKDVRDLGRIINEAFYIAASGRPGPVLVDIPVDVTVAVLDEEPNLEINLPGYKPRGGPGNDRQVRNACDAINESRCPVLYVGGGVISSGASQQLTAVARKASLPVTTTLLALGAFDESDPLSLGMLGMHGTAYANYAVQECDCLIAVGARFDDRVTGDLSRFSPKSLIIHVDIDPSSISKNVRVDIPLVGDAGSILKQMSEYLQPVDRSDWLKQIDHWKTQYPLVYDRDGMIKPQEVVEMLGEKTGHDAIIATGVGQNQMWAAQCYGWKNPRQILTSGGLGTMGYGVPAAIGAQFAFPDKLVVNIDGDGSFTMTMLEIITAVNYEMPVKFIVLDNSYLGMVRQWQELFYKNRYSGVNNKPVNFCEIARAYGAEAFFVKDRSELSSAMDSLLNSEGPCVLHVKIEQEENVWPMVATGKALDEMELGRLA